MALKQVLDAYELLDDPSVTGARVADWLRDQGADTVEVTRVEGARGGTDFIRVVIPGTAGKAAGGGAPTLGIIGRLGGLGARPERVGFVSDGDGALAAVAAAAKLTRMARLGDRLAGDVVVTTHICPDAPTRPHDPVPFMDSPVDIDTMNAHEVGAELDAILSIDATKGNRLCNHRGFAISPTVMLNAPVPAARKVLAKAGLTLDDIDLFEINEAFAVVAEKFIRDLKLDRNKVNVNGGAMALGHRG